MKWITYSVRTLAVILWTIAVVSLLATAGILELPTTGLYLAAVATPGFATVGMILSWHRPGNIIGWLMIGMGTFPALGALFGVDQPEFINGIILVCLALVLVVYPNGKAPSIRWRIPIGIMVGGWLLAMVAPQLVWSSRVDLDIPLGVAVAMLGLVWCAAAPFVRYRRAAGVERLQIRWLGATAATTGIAGTITLIGIVFSLPESIQQFAGLVAALAGALGIPISILMAILRYRLYDIDRIVSRTISYTVLVGIVATVYFGTVTLITAMMPAHNALVVAGATLVVAAIFNPLRREIRRRVDQRFNRSAFRAEQVAEAFAATLRSLHTTDEISGHWAKTIEENLQPDFARLWIRS